MYNHKCLSLWQVAHGSFSGPGTSLSLLLVLRTKKVSMYKELRGAPGTLFHIEEGCQAKLCCVAVLHWWASGRICFFPRWRSLFTDKLSRNILCLWWSTGTRFCFWKLCVMLYFVEYHECHGTEWIVYGQRIQIGPRFQRVSCLEIRTGEAKGVEIVLELLTTTIWTRKDSRFISALGQQAKFSLATSLTQEKLCHWCSWQAGGFSKYELI